MGPSLKDDLDGTPCAQVHCFEVADTIAQLTLRPPAEAGAAADDDVQILAVPLCIEHANLLRHGAELIDLEPGL